MPGIPGAVPPSQALAPEFLEEVYDFPDGDYALLRRRRRIGIGFKMSVAGGDVRLS